MSNSIFHKLKRAAIFTFKILVYRNPLYKSIGFCYWKKLISKDVDLLLGSQPADLLDIGGKKVLIVVAHMDDELIFAAPIIVGNWSKCTLVVATDGGVGRCDSLKKICNKRGVDLKFVNDIYEASEYPRSEMYQRDLNKNQKTKLSDILSELKNDNWDFVFTHNCWGEYGNGQHSAVSELVRKFFNDQRLVYFSFSELEKNKKEKNDLVFFPTSNRISLFSRGIFLSSTTKKYFFLDKNTFVSNRSLDLTLSLRALYKGFETWPMDGRSSLDQFLLSKRVCFYRPNLATRFLEHNINTNVRYFLDNFLIDYIKFIEGNLCWVGWDKMCVDHGYHKRFANTKFVTLDYKKRDYKEKNVDILGDICNLSGIVDDESFDMTVMNGVLEYVEDMGAALRELYRITKKGGRILLGTPGATWTNTGKNRPTKDFLVSSLEREFKIIEVWNINLSDYHYILLFKDY